MTADFAVYFDHNASTPLLPEAREVLLAALDVTGNPSSVHKAGRTLRALIETARDEVARATGAERSQVVFTGSATEAITQAISAGAGALGCGEIIVSAGEHAAVLKAAASGVPVRTVGLLPTGEIDMAALGHAVGEASAAGRIALIAVHWVNNETGVVQPIQAIEAMVGPTPHFLFVDAVQAFGKQPLDFSSRAADMMAISAHKIGGPAGVGALLMKGHCDKARLIPGGGQEQGRRGGTESAALIAGFGAAARAFPVTYRAAAAGELLAKLETGLLAARPDIVVFGRDAARIGNVIAFSVPGLKAAVAMMALDLKGIAVSSGSACSSGKVGKSHVLAAMGVAPHLMEGALRISLGWTSRRADIETFLAAFADIASRRGKGEAA